MSKQVLNVELREETGKGMESVAVSLDRKQFTEAIAGEGGRNHILTLKAEGALDGESVIVADLLQDPIKHFARHVDLHKINLADTVKVHVKLILVGTAAGAKAGGMVDFAMHEVEVECLPVHIPDHINVDITDLVLGHSIHVGDIVAPVGITILSDPKDSVVSILGRKGEAVEEPAA